MSNTEIDEYMNNLIEFSSRAQDKYAQGSFEYYKKLLSAIQMNRSDVQQIYEKEIKEALSKRDYFKLKSIFYHISKVKMLPCSSGGYDHCGRLWQLLDLLACDSYDNIIRVLPTGLPLASNGYPMFIHATNLLLCLLYNKNGENPYKQDKVIEKAEKFITSKKPLWERAVVACVLNIMEGDVKGFSENLQNVCDGYGKQSIAKYMKMQCQSAYGLVALAKNVWSQDEFKEVVLPDNKNFSKEYIQWFLIQEKISDDLFLTYETPLEEVNCILKKPVAITRIYQPNIDSDNEYLSAKDKKAYYKDMDTMLLEFLELGK